MSARDISRALRGSRNGKGFICRCPVSSHGKGKGDKNPSLSVADAPDGKLLVRCFAGCDPRDVLAELRGRGLLGEGQRLFRRRNVSRAVPPPEPEPEPDARALELWRSAIPAQGTLAEQYLRSRGITIEIPPTLRFIPSVDYLPRVSFPAMVAAVQGPDRRVVACQLTFLKRDGSGKAPVSAPRKTIGKLGSGAVRLGPAGDAVALAEGTETALAVMQLSGMACWASLGAARIHTIRLPSTVREVWHFPDSDDAGLTSVSKVFAAFSPVRRVVMQSPPKGFGDWNDYLNQKDSEKCTA
jgi:putative DNA primase/helicase